MKYREIVNESVNISLQNITPKIAYDACVNGNYVDVKDAFIDAYSGKSEKDIIKHFEDLIPTIKNNFKQIAKRSTITLYRGFENLQEQPDFNKLGIHWSLDSETAWEFADGYEGAIIEIKAKQNAIDWLQTVIRAVFWSMDNEINLWPGTEVKIVAFHTTAEYDEAPVRKIVNKIGNI